MSRDDLTWLRRRGDPRVLEFLERENERADREMAGLAELEARLYEEFRSRIQEDDRSVPARWGEYFYYHRTEAGKPYRIWARTHADPEGPEEVILDENELAAPHDFFAVGGHAVSPDHRTVAYVYDTTGDEEHTLVVKEIATGRHLTERIEGTAEDLAWAEDGKTLLYVTRDELKRAYRVYRHRIGYDPAEDTLVFEEHDPAFHVSLRKTRSRRFILIVTSSAITRDTLLVDANAPERGVRRLVPRQTGLEYDVSDGGDALFVRTNLGATNFRVLRAPVASDGIPAELEEWSEELAHRPEVMVAGVEAFRNHLVFLERENGVAHIRVRARDGSRPDYGVRFDEEVRAVTTGENLEFDATVFRYVFSSPITPPSTFDLDLDTGRSTLRKRDPVPGFDPSRYRTERVWATADDGARIPISIVYPHGLERGGSNPCLLNGYGAYGICLEPAFSILALSLLDRGFAYAIAHVRGGGELGETWHEQGRMLCKRNTFTDFIRCAESLVEEGYTSPERLGIQGRSAGGLLIGAVTNMRPDLFRAVVAGVPFVDVLATMLDPSIPLTVIEYEEWGDPKDPEYYDYIRSYSPFDNVRETDYPHILVTAGLHDPRVQYWEPARWVSRLRERRTDDGRLLLRTAMDAGHMGPSDRYAWLKEKAFEFAFLVDTLAPEHGRTPSTGV